MPTTIIDKDARLNIRLRPDIKERIERAANLSGKSLTDFAVNALSETADGVIEHHQTTTMSDKDRDIFLRVLDERVNPNALLLRSRKTHKRLITK